MEAATKPDSDKPFCKPKVLVKTRHSIKDAFTDVAVCLFIPMDRLGHPCEVQHAARLECWTLSDHRRHRISPTLASSNLMTCALMRKDDCEIFSPLSRNVAFATLRVAEEWLYRLHRDPKKDYETFEAFISNEVQA